jgi:hypothetical protein
MLKTKYYKDMNQNYLIIDCPETPANDRYQLKMITENNIPGLLKVSKRHINAKAFLYYEINSLQTLQSMFENRKLNKAMAICLLNDLRQALREIKNYLLSDNELILRPEYIYLNWEKEKAYFVYYPYEDKDEQNQISYFFEYLVRIIDHRDENLTDAIYGLCGSAERGLFTADEIDRYLYAISYASSEQAKYEQNLPEQNTIAEDAMISAQPEKYPVFAAHEENIFTKQSINPYGIDNKKQKLKLLILAVISAAGTAFTFFYQQLFILTARELLLSWILVMVLLIFFVITAVIYIYLRITSGKGENKSKLIAENYFPSENEHQQIPDIAPVNDNYGETVFMSDYEGIRENKLYGISKGNKYIIELESFPFTIGKLMENSDYCLKETSISRIHARFTQNERDVFVTDLNSTNGTYKNGVRLEPSETVPLDAGDEIRLGKLSFCYR